VPKQLRHEYDLLNFLAEHKKGLTFDQIVHHFAAPPLPKGAPQRKVALAVNARFKLRLKILGYLEKLLKTDEVVLSKGVYKANFPLCEDIT
jgi:hypothetical protein